MTTTGELWTKLEAITVFGIKNFWSSYNSIPHLIRRINNVVGLFSPSASTLGIYLFFNNIKDVIDFNTLKID